MKIEKVYIGPPGSGKSMQAYSDSQGDGEVRVIDLEDIIQRELDLRMTDPGGRAYVEIRTPWGVPVVVTGGAG